MLRGLETKLPPPVVLILCGALAWIASAVVRADPIELPYHATVVLLLAAAGVALNALPKLLFTRAGTTVNPMRPDLTAHLVTTGPYRWTRNPMYLGQALLLTGWALFLAHPAAFLAVAAFVAYITWFQIRPEEEMLHRRFPGAYAAFCERTRRWL